MVFELLFTDKIKRKAQTFLKILRIPLLDLLSLLFMVLVACILKM